jgi:hypothetical protein
LALRPSVQKILKKKTRDKRKRVQKYLAHAHKVCHLWQNSFGSKLEAYAEFEEFFSFRLSLPIYELKNTSV